MKHFRTKRNYHDADIIRYNWHNDDLILEVNQRYKPVWSSEIQFLGVKNKDEINQNLFEKVNSSVFSQKVIANIVRMGKSEKQEFIIDTTPGPSLRIICNGILEI